MKGTLYKYISEGQMDPAYAARILGVPEEKIISEMLDLGYSVRGQSEVQSNHVWIQECIDLTMKVMESSIRKRKYTIGADVQIDDAKSHDCEEMEVADPAVAMAIHLSKIHPEEKMCILKIGTELGAAYEYDLFAFSTLVSLVGGIDYKKEVEAGGICVHFPDVQIVKDTEGKKLEKWIPVDVICCAMKSDAERSGEVMELAHKIAINNGAENLLVCPLRDNDFTDEAAIHSAFYEVAEVYKNYYRRIIMTGGGFFR